MDKFFQFDEVTTIKSINNEQLGKLMDKFVDQFYQTKSTVIIFGLSILFFISIGYIYYRNKFTYWERRGIVTPPITPFIGHIKDLVVAPTIRYSSWVNKYGPVFGIYLGTEHALVISDADLLTDILITNFKNFSDRRVGSGIPLSNQNIISQNGIQWKHDRTIMSPTFTSGKMKMMYPLMQEAYKLLEAEVEIFAKSGCEVTFKSVFGKLTTMIIARCAFGAHVDAYNDGNNELLRMLKKFFTFTKLRNFGRFFLPESIKKLIGFTSVDREAIEYLGKLCTEVIRKRKQNGHGCGEYKDLLQLLIETNENNSTEQKGFSEIKIVANAILFFIAGFETTSTLLNWTTYALAMNPLIQERLYKEVKEVFDQKGELDYETLVELKYLDAVLKESLRIYPPLIRVERIATTDHTLPNGLKIEKGTSIHIPIYAIHHKRQYFPNPELFDPDRFMDENKAKVKSCSYLPFLQGPRNCIGSRFALLEAKMAISGLILNYKFVKLPTTPKVETSKFIKNTIALELDDMPIKVEKRW